MEIINFKNKDIRTVEHNGTTWYSVVDVVAILSASNNPRKYWSDLKNKLKTEGSEVSENLGQFKLLASDGKMRLTDCLPREGVLRLIQSIPSPNAEPFKMWLANTGETSIKEIEDPSLLIDRLKESLRKKGYDQNWIDARIRSIQVRAELTAEWEKRGIKNPEYAILTNLIMKNTFGLDTSEHKALKGLVRQNLRDHFSDLELAFTIIAESTTKQLAIKENAQGFNENKVVSNKASKLVGDSRKRFEKSTGLKVTSPQNFLDRIKGK